MKQITERQSKSERDRTHTMATITPRQIARMKAGRIESQPGDYDALQPTVDGARMREARWAAEDRRMRKELGL